MQPWDRIISAGLMSGYTHPLTEVRWRRIIIDEGAVRLDRFESVRYPNHKVMTAFHPIQ
jgi:hypothetical protein